MKRALVPLCLVACALCSPPAAARPRTHVWGRMEAQLRMATVAPDGTAWAHELKSFANEISDESNGAVRMKWYFGGIAGDDIATGQRIARGQLDGTSSGGMLCEELAPAFRGIRLLGLYRSRDEAAYVYSQLRPLFDRQFAQQGFVNLAEGGLGSVAVFSRMPIGSMAALRAHRLWQWNRDVPQMMIMKEMGLKTLPLPLDQAAKAYADGRTDGFYSIPGAALAYQWSAQARYVTDLRMDYLVGCVIVSSRAFDRLSLQNQQVVRAAGARLHLRFESMMRDQDEQLFAGGLFRHQGLREVPVSASFRADFLQAAEAARKRLGDKLISPDLREQVRQLLDTYRTLHPARAATR